MIKIRLRRMGAKKRPFYRVVVAEHSMKRDGRFIENLGHYDPLTDPATFKVNSERAQYWLSVGAKPSETVEALLKKDGVIPADKNYNKPRSERKPYVTSAEAPKAEAGADEESVVEAEATDAEETPEKPVEATEQDPAEGAAESEDDKS